ncbi:MAG TPA: ankyrin repeat domain-containing protein [Candidatus Saccharimonadales bacterium]|nr:ankyrin repeat domain-containing protein [Candidatus Saccharimonadales bacterium]
MKTKLWIWIFLLTATLAQAQSNTLSSLLQQGLLEEQANRNLDAAIADYQSLANQFDKDRQLAATAIFRIGECYRMQGKTNEAAAQYQRILREFPSEKTLATLSQQNLTGMGVALGNISPPSTSVPTSPSVTLSPNLRHIPDAEDNEIQRIQQMIRNSPDLINTSDSSGLTPLCTAARYGQVRVAEFLLTNGADANLNSEHGPAPLYFAAIAGQNAMVKLLLDHKATIGNALYEAAGRGYKTVAETLLAYHADINAVTTKGETALDAAAANGHLAIVQLLLAHGAEVDLKVNNGRARTALGMAASRPQNTPIIRALLDAHANPNADKWDAPLLGAIYVGDRESAELLLQAGANPNKKGAEDIQGNVNGVALTPLSLALSMDQLSMVQLLLKFKADPNDSQTFGRPVLFEALGDTNLLHALLDAGAKVDAPDEHASMNGYATHWTPLEAAVSQNNLSAVEFLLKHGANPNLPDQRGDTPLHWAAQEPAAEQVFRLLMDVKADPNVRDLEGKTPLDLLKEKLPDPSSGFSVPDREILVRKEIDLLRKYGVLENPPDWRRIVVSRPSSKYSKAVFQKGTNDWNHFSLLELIYDAATWPHERGYPRRIPGFDNGISPLEFADLAHLVIVRPGASGNPPKRIEVNLFDSTNGVDFSKDLPLEFGDVVEIPEREHALADPPLYLPANQLAVILDYFKSNAGEAKLVVGGGQAIPLPIEPFHCQIGQMLRSTAAQNALTSDSDLGHVKVTRRGPATIAGEWILDCSHLNDHQSQGFLPPSMLRPEEVINAPDLWIRNGDVIEVPKK